MHYNYFRDYDASIGRYVQSDPVGLIAGLDTYGYVTGDPLSYVDRDGRALSAAGIIFVGLGAYGAYKIWDASSSQDRCEKYCLTNCANIRACGDTERNFMLEANLARCITVCKSNCFVESWMGGPKKGPTGPTPPKNATDFLK